MQSEIHSHIDIYNEEFPRIEKVLQALNEKTGKMGDAEAYRREIIERFEGIGLVVKIDVLVPGEACVACGGAGTLLGTPVPCLPCLGSGTIAEGKPDFVAYRIHITDRVGRHEMDWEKFGEQIRADSLGIGEGAIKPAHGHIDHPGHKKGSGCC
jgi:hypothetical protein